MLSMVLSITMTLKMILIFWGGWLVPNFQASFWASVSIAWLILKNQDGSQNWFWIVLILFQLYSDAEKSFAQVLKLDKHCEDAMFELARVRVQQLEVRKGRSWMKKNPFKSNLCWIWGQDKWLIPHQEDKASFDCNYVVISIIFAPFLVQEMGFAQNQSEAAIQAYGTVQAALEALLAGKGKWP